MDNKVFEFPVTIYGKLEPYNQVLSKARCRVFYKYLNRNGAYITDEFAEKLTKTIAYAPIKGIYNNMNEDYEDHGKERNLGKIYGVVPENPHPAYESHLDEDGIERNYFCVDVLLYTALYDEAKEIVGKGQSMELFPPSIKGEWKIIDGQKAFVYTEGCFLGLQVLGDEVEPCFEGASFYSYAKSLNNMLDEFKKFTLDQFKGGQSKMDKINFRLSDAQKHDALWSALNPNFTEESGWAVDYAICDIYDDYALAYCYETQSYERVYYTKEENAVTIGEKKQVFILDISEAELNALNAVRAINGGSFEKAEEVYSIKENLETANATLTTEKENFEQKIVELNESISTLQIENERISAEVEQFTAKNEALTSSNAELSTEVENLRSYQVAEENAKKSAVIAKYSKLLTEDTLKKYEDLDKFTVSQLNKELALELVDSNPSIFSLDVKPQYVPKDTPATGVAGILDKYKKMEE